MRGIFKRFGGRLRLRGWRAGREDASGGRAGCAFVAAVLFSVLSANACPLCKDSTPVSDARGDNAVTDAASLNLNGSIYGLLGGVTLAGAVVTVAMIKAGRAS